MAIYVETDFAEFEFPDGTSQQDIESAIDQAASEFQQQNPKTGSPMAPAGGSIEPPAPAIEPVTPGAPMASDQAAIDSPFPVAQSGSFSTQQAPNALPAQPTGIYDQFKQKVSAAVQPVVDAADWTGEAFEGFSPSAIYGGMKTNFLYNVQDMNESLWDRVEKNMANKPENVQKAFWEKYGDLRPESRRALEERGAAVEEAEAAMQENRPEDLSFWQKAARDGVESVVVNAPSTVMAIMQANPLSLAYFGGATASDVYAETRKEGASRAKAGTRAAIHGLSEVLTEVMPTKKLGGIAKNPTMRRLSEYLIHEQLGEQVNFLTTTATDIAMGEGIGKYWGEMDTTAQLNYIWQNMKETAAATAVASVLQGETANLAGSAYKQYEKSQLKKEIEAQLERAESDGTLDEVQKKMQGEMEGMEAGIDAQPTAEQKPATQDTIVETSAKINPETGEPIDDAVKPADEPQPAPKEPDYKEKILSPEEAEKTLQSKQIRPILKDIAEKDVDRLMAPVREDDEDLRTLAAKWGGINRAEAEAQGVDPAQFKERSGKNWLYPKQGGMSMDDLAERMYEAGFIDSVDAEQARQAWEQVTAGEMIYTPEGEMRAAERDQEFLSIVGHDPKIVRRAIYKHLGGNKLNKVEREVLRDVVAHLPIRGQPVEDTDARTAYDEEYGKAGTQEDLEARSLDPSQYEDIRFSKKDGTIDFKAEKAKRWAKDNKEAVGFLQDAEAAARLMSLIDADVGAGESLWETFLDQTPIPEPVLKRMADENLTASEAVDAYTKDLQQALKDEGTDIDAKGLIAYTERVGGKVERFLDKASKNPEIGMAARAALKKLRAQGKKAETPRMAKRKVSRETLRNIPSVKGQKKRINKDVRFSKKGESDGEVKVQEQADRGRANFWRIWEASGLKQPRGVGRGSGRAIESTEGWAFRPVSTNIFLAAEDVELDETQGKQEQQALIEKAKEEGVFFEPDSEIFDLLDTGDKTGGMEHDAWIIGEREQKTVVRSTKRTDHGSLYGHTSKVSPAKYLDRNKDFNLLFPHLQIDVIGVSQDADGNATLLTAQPYTKAKKFKSVTELDAAMNKKGWYRTTAMNAANRDKPARYEHKESGAVINDVTLDNVLGKDGVLYPIDVYVEKMPDQEYAMPMYSKKPSTRRTTESQVDVSKKPSFRELVSIVHSVPFLKGNVKVVRDHNSLPDVLRDAVAAEKAVEPDAKFPGIYYQGKAYIVHSDNKDLSDGIKAAMHETVGHKGVREVLGDKAVDVFKQVAKSKSKRIKDLRREIEDNYAPQIEAMKKDGSDPDVLIGDEIIAHYIERKEKRPGIIKWAIAQLKQIIREKTGLPISYSDADIDLLMKKSVDHLTNTPTAPPGLESLLADPRYMVAWHGTPYSFDKFSLEAIGTGEGAQAYGWGLYFAGRRSVAEWYRDTLTKRQKDAFGAYALSDVGEQVVKKARDMADKDNNGILAGALEEIAIGDFSIDKIRSNLAGALEEQRLDEGIDPAPSLERFDSVVDEISKEEGNLYQVDIPEDSELLDYDKPIAGQSDAIKQKLFKALPSLEEAIKYDPHLDWRDIQDNFDEGTPKELSLLLNEVGIPGLRYENFERSTEGAGHNYVIWDEDVVTIEAVNDEMRQAEQQEVRLAKRPGKTEITGDLATVNKAARDAAESAISRMPKREASRLRKELAKHKGTPWAAATVKGLVFRELIHRATKGQDVSALESNEIWGKQNLSSFTMVKALKAGPAAINAFMRSYSFIGTNRKAENQVSTSFANCNPSKACAKFCYATAANTKPTEIMKSEFTEWALSNYFDEVVRSVKTTYLASPAGMAGLALRINDKGDLSNAQIKLINQLNKEGIAVQVFSKRPELLRKLDDVNWKALSIDDTNFDLARKNPDLGLAVTLTDGFTEEMVAEIADRVFVYLPVNLRGSDWSAAELRKMYPNTYSEMRKRVCPVEVGSVVTVPNASYVEITTGNAPTGLKGKKAWTCTSCDMLGTVGCFRGKSQTKNRWKSAQVIATDYADSQRAEQLRNESIGEMKRLLKAGAINNEQYERIVAELSARPAEVREGDDPGSESGVREKDGGARKKKNAGRKRARKDSAEQIQLDLIESVPGNTKAENKEALEVVYHALYEQVETRTIQAGTDVVKTPHDVASLIAPIRKEAQEKVFAVVADKNGKVVNIIHHTKGGPASASIHPEVLIPAVMATPNADKVWFVHNHPTGDPTPSMADKQMQEKIASMIIKAGLEPQPDIVIGAREFAFHGDEDYRGPSSAPIPPQKRDKKIPVTERVIRKRPPQSAFRVSSPEGARAMLKDSGMETGLLLLNSKHTLVAVVPMTDKQMQNLMENKLVVPLMEAIDKSGATAVVIAANDPKDSGINMSKLFNSIEMRVLDVLDNSVGLRSSTVQMGKDYHMAQGVYYAKRRPDEGISVPDETRIDAFLRLFQDKMRRLKVVQKEIEKSVGERISRRSDAYTAEEAFHGKTANDIERLENDFIEPLIKLMAKNNISLDMLDTYLLAKHAPERNRRIAQIRDDMPDNGSGMSTEQAISLVKTMETGKQGLALKKAAAIVQQINDMKLQYRAKAGLIDQDMYDEYKSGYEFYVPLKGMAYNEQLKKLPRTGKGFNIQGKEDKAAKGRISPPESPLTHLVSDTVETIVRSRKNEVGNAFLSLARDNPAPNLWEVFSADRPDSKRTLVDRKAKDTRMTPAEMKAATDNTGRPIYFTTKVDGKEYFIKIKDPRLMDAMMNLGVDSSSLVVRTLGNITRFLSQTLTSWNPEFIISNFARDIQTAVYNLMAEQSSYQGKISGQSMAAKVVRDTPRSVAAVLRGEFQRPKSKKFDEYYAEFKAAGAKTGWFHAKDIEGLKRDLEKMLSREGSGIIPTSKRALHNSLKAIERINTAIENGVRLSTYVHAREAGISKQDAASLAKNLTVNFNRKGELGAAMNALYIFFNASVQGTAQLARTLGLPAKTKSGKWRPNNAQIAMASMLGAGYMMAEIMRAISDTSEEDDEYYDEIPDYIKERNIVVMDWRDGHREKGEYWLIPLPYGYSIFYSSGTYLNEMAEGSRSVPETSWAIFNGLTGSFSPMGLSYSEDPATSMLKSGTPTVLRPVAELAANENFFGAPIYREPFPGQVPRPDSYQSMKSTGEVWKMLAETINDATGGDAYVSGAADWSPDSMEHLYEFFTGGIGRLVGRTATAVEKAAQGEISAPRDIPFVRRLRGAPSEYEAQSRYYARRDKVMQRADSYEALIDEDPEKAKAYYDKHKDEIELGIMAQDIEKELRKVRKAIREAEELDDKELIELEKQAKYQLFYEFNREFNNRLRKKK